MGTPEGQPTLWTIAKQYIKERYQKPGNVYLGVVSRLDSPGDRRGPFCADLEGRRAADRTIPHPDRGKGLLGNRGRDRGAAGGRVRRLGVARRASPSGCAWSARWCPTPGRPGSRIAARRARATPRCWKWSWRPAGSTRSACSWPTAATRSWAMPSTAATARLPWDRLARPPLGVRSSGARRADRAARRPFRRVGAALGSGGRGRAQVHATNESLKRKRRRPQHRTCFDASPVEFPVRCRGPAASLALSAAIS